MASSDDWRTAGWCFNRGVMPSVLIDAENVRRSTRPNLSPADLLERCRSWGERENVRVIVVFDGAPPAMDANDVEGADGSSTDDRIVALAGTLDGSIWLVTSDRELRDRMRRHADRVIGGGTFVRQSLHG